MTDQEHQEAEEREAMDRASLIASIPHTMAEFALEMAE